MQTIAVTATSPSPPFAWQDHHFVAGSPAIDFANSVVYRLDRARREDRFRQPADVDAWAVAAGLAVAPVAAADWPDVIAVRDSIDCFFRTASGSEAAAEWQRMVRLYARHVAALQDVPHPGLLAFILHAAVALRFSPSMLRVKACGGCGWLFLDRTRNASKRWCISALCGNRDKARRYYHRRKQVL